MLHDGCAKWCIDDGGCGCGGAGSWQVLCWLPAWWRLGFEDKLGFLMGEIKMMMWQCMVDQFGEWRIMTRVIMWLDRFRR